MMKKIIAVFALFFLVACTTTVPQTRIAPDLTFAHLRPIPVNVDQIFVRNSYDAPMGDPNVEHRLDPTPAAALYTWADHRFEVGGQPNDLVLTFDIYQADIIREEIKRSGSFTDLFSVDQREQFTLNLAMTLMLDKNDNTVREQNIQIMQSTTVGENASPVQREQVLLRLTEQAMDRLDRQVVNALENDFGVIEK
jgi:hypothetical protein